MWTWLLIQSVLKTGMLLNRYMAPLPRLDVDMGWNLIWGFSYLENGVIFSHCPHCLCRGKFHPWGYFALGAILDTATLISNCCTWWCSCTVLAMNRQGSLLSCFDGLLISYPWWGNVRTPSAYWCYFMQLFPVNFLVSLGVGAMQLYQEACKRNCSSFFAKSFASFQQLMWPMTRYASHCKCKTFQCVTRVNPCDHIFVWKTLVFQFTFNFQNSGRITTCHNQSVYKIQNPSVK